MSKIVWMDHRAIAEAEYINQIAASHDVLRCVGAKISPEMEIPKILWLKINKPQTFQQATYFMDLVDFITYKCTDVPVRSLCTTVCKWTYLNHTKNEGDSDSVIIGWCNDFFEQIGLRELVEEGYARIGTPSQMQPLCSCIGNGLTETAAKVLGLLPGTIVATGIIDAHAGGVGMIGAALPKEIQEASSISCVSELEGRLALICGTR